MAIVLLLLLAILASASSPYRDYCYTGTSCTSQQQCLQNVYPPTSPMKGDCCMGRCVGSYPVLERGATCNVSTPCAGVCESDSGCVNNTCQGLLAPGCACQTDTDCVNGLCSQQTAGGVCLWSNLGYNAPCSRNEQCETLNCLSGMCTGEERETGWTCRQGTECDTGYCSTNGICSLVPAGGQCTDTEYCVAGLVCRGAPGMCQQPSAINTACQFGDECAENADCNVQDSNGSNMVCKLKIAIGGTCDSSATCVNTGACMTTCVDTAVCSNGMCIAWLSRPRGAACYTPRDCVDGSTCSTTTNNATVMSCIASMSVQPGSYCTPGSTACLNNSICDLNLTTGNAMCGPVITTLSCNVNSTTSDNTQCLNMNYNCGCNSLCFLNIAYEVGSDICYAVDEAYEMIPSNVPGNMTIGQTTAWINSMCCQMCLEGNGMNIPDVSETGYTVDCGLKVMTTTTNYCMKTRDAGVAAFQNCNKFTLPNAAFHTSGMSFALLAVLLCLSLFAA